MLILNRDKAEWRVEEQIVEDPASGLTVQFEVMPDSKIPYRLRIFGNLPNANREILFDENGIHAGAATTLSGLSKPTWTCQVDL